MISTNMITVFLVFAFLVDNTMSACPKDTSATSITLRIGGIPTTTTCGNLFRRFPEDLLCTYSFISFRCCQQCQTYVCPDDTSQALIEVTLNGVKGIHTCEALFKGSSQKEICRFQKVERICCRQCLEEFVCPNDTSLNLAEVNVGGKSMSYRCGYLLNSYSKEILCIGGKFNETCCQDCSSEKPTKYNESISNKLEIFVYVDEAAVQRHVTTGKSESAAREEIRKEMEYNFFHMNRMFETLWENGVIIKLYLAGIEFMKNLLDGSAGLVDGRDFHKNFTKVEAVKEKFKEFDMVMLYTGFDLASPEGDSNVEGVADYGRVCKIRGVAAVTETKGTFHAVTIGAHEIGHALGVSHDEGACFDDYIMSNALSADSPNRWSFSKCTANQIKNYIGNLTYNCMLDLRETSKEITEYSQDLGILNPTKVCRRTLDDSYYEADVESSQNPCQIIRCRSDEQLLEKNVPASDGMSCGNSKICSRGKCFDEDPKSTENLG